MELSSFSSCFWGLLGISGCPACLSTNRIKQGHLQTTICLQNRGRLGPTEVVLDQPRSSSIRVAPRCHRRHRSDAHVPGRVVGAAVRRPAAKVAGSLLDCAVSFGGILPAEQEDSYGFFLAGYSWTSKKATKKGLADPASTDVFVSSPSSFDRERFARFVPQPWLQNSSTHLETKRVVSLCVKTRVSLIHL